MDVRSGFLDSIGNTPLIKLRKASEATGCNIYGKAEFLNPGQSIKDRAALAMVLQAEKDGLLQPGDTLLEPTSGNTGMCTPLAPSFTQRSNSLTVTSTPWLTGRHGNVTVLC